MKQRLLAACLLCLATAQAYAARDAVPDWHYTIRPGDTLIGFSARYLAHPLAWPRVQAMNRIADPYRLRPGSSLRVPVSMLRRSPAPARVTAVHGQVDFTPATGAAHALKVGDLLPAGSRLDSAADSSASLLFADGSVLVLQPGSTLHMDTVSVYAGGGMADTRVRLQAGRVEISANPKHTQGTRLEVTTPSAVAAVRGTQFRVGADANSTQQETLVGRVGLRAARHEVAVAAGMGAVAEAGHAPSPPVALLDAPDLSGVPARIEYLPLRFAWPALAAASGWLAQVAPDAGFNQVLLQKNSVAPQASFADLPDGHYVLRVRGIDAHGLQGRDALHAFTLDARPFAPLLLYPAPGGVVRTASPELRWSEAIGEDGKAIASYRVELAHDAAFTDTVQADTRPQTQLTPAHALVAGQYFWRVASIAGDDQGPFAAPAAFVYKPAPGAPDLAQSALQFDPKQVRVTLPPPAAGLHYEALLSNDAARHDTLGQGSSADGKLVLARPEPGKRYLSVRMVEADGTAGPYATQAIEVPRTMRWGWLLLVVPALFAL